MKALWLDKLGMTASLGCAVHCVLTALLFVIVPSLFQSLNFVNELSFLQDEWIHIGMALVVFPVAILALTHGYKAHGNRNALILGAIGLTLLTLGLIAGHGQLATGFTIAGGLLLATAHFFNLRYCQ